MPPAATMLSRILCPLVTPFIPPIPHVAGGVILEGCFTVLIGGKPAATVGSQALCAGPPPHPAPIVLGSFTVLIGGKPAARLGDLTATGGMIMDGDFTVEIG